MGGWGVVARPTSARSTCPQSEPWLALVGVCFLAIKGKVAKSSGGGSDSNSSVLIAIIIVVVLLLFTVLGAVAFGM